MSTSTRIARRAVRQIGTVVAEIPAFLCPGIPRTACQPVRCLDKSQRRFSPALQRRNITSVARDDPRPATTSRVPYLERLPQQCAGCGALSQTVDSEGPGFYTLTRKSVKSFVGGTSSAGLRKEDEILKAALENAGSEAANLNFSNVESLGQNLEMPVLNCY